MPSFRADWQPLLRPVLCRTRPPIRLGEYSFGKRFEQTFATVDYYGHFAVLGGHGSWAEPERPDKFTSSDHALAANPRSRSRDARSTHSAWSTAANGRYLKLKLKELMMILSHSRNARHRHRNRKILAFALCMAAGGAGAQCPGNGLISGREALVAQQGMAGLYTLIGTGCTANYFGSMQPSQCSAIMGSFGGVAYAQVRAIWPDASSNTTMNGCNFICGGGACTIRGGDALPVELLDFSVHEDPPEDEE